MKVFLIAGARPNFMKVAPLFKTLARGQFCNPILVHTGQHYDDNMSGVFWRDLELPEPALHLGAGSGTHAEQTARVMTAFEVACKKEQPEWVVVVGDVNSTMACAITAKKLCLNVAHIEAGLRSRDRRMPEEINRIVTDAISDLLFTPSEDADMNLLREGVSPEKICRVGNIMIDSVITALPRARTAGVPEQWGVTAGAYGFVTLHRPSNVDNPVMLRRVVECLRIVGVRIPLIFPTHPRTRD